MNENKNEKKILFAMLFFCLTVLALYNTMYQRNKNDNLYDYVDDIYEMYQHDVDSGISELLKSEEFESMDDDSKIDSMNQLLDRYVSSGEIKNLYYSKTDKMYSFEYANGILGGVWMKAFDPYLN